MGVHPSLGLFRFSSEFHRIAFSRSDIAEKAKRLLSLNVVEASYNQRLRGVST
jgi:hypothetical protein